MYILIDEKGRKYLVKGTSDIHTNYGVIPAEDMSEKNVGSILKTHMDREFFLLKPNMVDFMEKSKRGPQTISLKDCSLIAGYTGIQSKSKVVDAGVGSGMLSMFLSKIVRPETINAYEVREDFAKIAQKNIEKAGIENIKIKIQDIYEGIDEDNLDLITLDLPEPDLVVCHAKKSLGVGGYLVSYSPSIEQSKRFCDKLDEHSFMHETVECIVRNWNMKVVRPYSRMLGHTGFITFGRLMCRD